MCQEKWRYIRIGSYIAAALVLGIGILSMIIISTSQILTNGRGTYLVRFYYSRCLV